MESLVEGRIVPAVPGHPQEGTFRDCPPPAARGSRGASRSAISDSKWIRLCRAASNWSGHW